MFHSNAGKYIIYSLPAPIKNISTQQIMQVLGHLFQGRYKALLIDADAYLHELVRYVHLNPVRAGTCVTPEKYTWSGHRGYLGVEQIPWLSTELVLSMFSSRKDQALAAYELFVNDGLSEGRRGEFHSGTCEGRILGDDLVHR